MSRTYTHAPLRVIERRHHSATEVHLGCVHDPSGEGRIVGYRTEEIVHPANYGTRMITTHGEVPKGARRCDRDGNVIDFSAEDEYDEVHGFRYRILYRSSAFSRCDRTDCDGDEGLREHFFFRLDGFLETYTEKRFVPVRKIVPCDIKETSWGRGKCYVEADLPREVYRTHGGGRCRCCSWCDDTVLRAHEDSVDRAYLRRAAAEYNTFGELEEYADEPHRAP